MWTVKISRRDFFELTLAGSNKAIQNKAREEIGFPLFNHMDGKVTVCWSSRPTDEMDFPVLAVIPDAEISDFLAALNASPQAPLPFTAFCRVISAEDARSYTEMIPWPISKQVSQVIASLALVEAYLHTEGKIGIHELSPAACKRTLSYVWATAISTNIPPEALQRLPDYWLDTYRLLNSPDATESIRMTVSAAIPVLSAATEVCTGVKSSTVIGKLCYALLAEDRDAQESAWESLSEHLPINISLHNLAIATREERGAYLQAALRVVTADYPNDYRAVACAFLATQVAPGSLVHLDLLRTSADLRTVFWYVLLANFQTPISMLSANAGLARRLLRDIHKIESLDSSPTSDLAYNELRVISKIGIDDISQKLSHSNEIEVELVPLVVGTFRFPRKAREEMQSLQSFCEDGSLRKMSPRERLEDIISTLTEMSNSFPPNPRDEDFFKGKRSRKRY